MPKGSRRAGRFGAALAASFVAAALLPGAAHALTYTVNDTAGTTDGSCSVGTCTFRDAITQANALPAAPDQITFSVTGRINLSNQNVVTDSVDINGGGTIELDGNNTVGDALQFSGAGNSSTVRGLSIINWGSAGVTVTNGATAVIQTNRIGVDLSGVADGNAFDGVNVTASAGGATIGGTAVGEGNVISANGFDGIYIEGSSPDVVVQGNRIGTNVAGTAALGTQPNGVVINDGSTHTIGGSAPGAANVISGNTSAGVSIEDSTSLDNAVTGNLIGLAADGTTVIGNGSTGTGVAIADTTSGNIVARNTIAGGSVGVSVNGDDSLVQGNTISATTVGVAVAPTADRTTIGGNGDFVRNVLSGNAAGIQTDGPSTKIYGNYIGLASDGLTASGNTTSGVIVQNTADNTEVGGPGAGEGNLIGSNGAAGVVVRDGPSGVRIRGNSIGLNKNGEPRRNGSAGVRIFDAANNTVGGTIATEANTIAFNSDQGVNINRIDGVPEEPTGNQVLINSIHSNGALGIDLSADIFGRTVNDAGDADSGANGLQNFPVIGTAYDAGNVTDISGTFNSAPNSTYKIRYFSNPAGTGQAETYIGEQDVTTDGAGNAAFAITSGPAVALGRTITATATDAGGNTSEISDPVAVTTRPAAPPPPGPPGPPAVDPRLGVLGFRTSGSFKSSKTKVTFKLKNNVTYPISITVTGREGKVGKTKGPKVKTVKTTIKAGQTKTITLSIPSATRKALSKELKKKKSVVRRLDLRVTNTTGVVSRSYKPRVTVKR